MAKKLDVQIKVLPCATLTIMEETTSVYVSLFVDWAIVYTDDEGNKLVIVESEPGSILLIAFDAAGKLTLYPTTAFVNQEIVKLI